jgi:hypothetical protein
VFHLPTRSDCDVRLVSGAAIFGVGWGISGFCPGPAVTAVPMAAQGTIVFIVAMLIGMAAAKYFIIWRDRCVGDLAGKMSQL